MSEKPNIYSAINEVMSEVSYVQKRKDPRLQYSYVADEDIVKALRPSLVKHGIVIHPAEIVETRQEVLNRPENKLWFHITVIGSVRFSLNPESFIDVPSLGESIDTYDKGSQKALSFLVKNALLKTFLLETGDAPNGGGQPPKTKTEPKTAPTTEAKIEPRQCLEPADLQDAIRRRAAEYDAKERTVTKGFRGMIRGQLGELFTGLKEKDKLVHSLFDYLFSEGERSVTSSNNLSAGEVLSLKDWLSLEKHNGSEIPCAISIQEAQAVIVAHLKDRGQEDLFPE